MKPSPPKKVKSDAIRWLRGLFTPGGRPATIATTATVPVLSQRPANGKKILVVDDDPVFLRATVTIFESNGFTVIIARDGSDGIQAARQENPSLLILDVNLSTDVASGGSVPWDGFRIISWLQRFDELRKIPVVLTSSGDPVENTWLAIRAGAVAFFHKQMNLNQLLSIVNTTLARLEIVRAPVSETCFKSEPRSIDLSVK